MKKHLNESIIEIAEETKENILTGLENVVESIKDRIVSWRTSEIIDEQWRKHLLWRNRFAIVSDLGLAMTVFGFVTPFVIRNLFSFLQMSNLYLLNIAEKISAISVWAVATGVVILIPATVIGILMHIRMFITSCTYHWARARERSLAGGTTEDGRN